MSWKASSLGAVVVVVAGVLAGLAIGGKTKTKVDTVTVVHKVKVLAASPSSTSSTETTSSTPAPSSVTASSASGGATHPGGSQEQYLSRYLESQGGAETLNQDAENASLDSTPSQRELAGQTYEHAVAFDLNASEEGTSARFQIPTPGFSRLGSTAAGLETTTNARAAYRLTIYRNDDSSPNSVVLYQATFRGPSTVHRISFDTQGATDLLLVWTHKAAEPGSGDVFILADPVLTGRVQ